MFTFGLATGFAVPSGERTLFGVLQRELWPLGNNRTLSSQGGSVGSLSQHGVQAVLHIANHAVASMLTSGSTGLIPTHRHGSSADWASPGPVARDSGPLESSRLENWQPQGKLCEHQQE